MDFTTDAKWTIKEIDINEIFDKFSQKEFLNA